jgi:hypothetical protein
MQDIKGEFNKDRERLKNLTEALEMKTYLS